MSRKKTLGSVAPCGLAMSDCSDAACAEYATCGKRVSASAAPCGLAMSDCTDACAEYATCQKKATASAAPCGLAMSECTDACAEYATCQKKATASAAPCGLAMSECTDACAEYATCQKKATGFITLKQLEDAAKRGKLLSWGDAEARPCTEGDDDSQYGPRGDDQKCTDEGGGGGYHDDTPDCTSPGCDLEEGHGGTHITDESRDAVREQNRQRSAEEGGDYDDEPASDVPEGYQEVDMGDPSLDPEGGDWEEFLTEPEEEAPLKETMKEEERVGKKASEEKAVQDKKDQRTATRIGRDQNLRPEDYHQFWNQDVWHINQAREILEHRAANPKSSEDADAVRSLLMNGPKVGGGYEKAGKRESGEPGAEDFYQKEDKSPIV